MDKAYFARRLLEAFNHAEQAASAAERSIHLRALQYYRQLLMLRSRAPQVPPDPRPPVAEGDDAR